MKTFKITINRQNEEQEYEKLKDVFVNSENNANEIRDAYSQRYSGFIVYVEEIKNITIFKKEEEEEKLEIKESKVIFNEEREFTSAEYSARIYKKNIKEEWSERVNKLDPLMEQINNIENEFKQKIIEKFNLKQVSDFKVLYDGISFRFYPGWFDFKIKENNK